jgi:hypothetical protein
MEQHHLFDEPARTSPELSNLTRREAAGTGTTALPVHWRKLNRHGMTCDECLALQYETKGKSNFHGPARIERVCNAASLYLCWTHAELWKARDRGE